MAQDGDPASLHCEEAQDALDGRGLPRAVGTQEAVDLARPDVEGQAIDRLDGPEMLDQSLDG